MRPYSIVFGGVTVSAAQDLFMIAPAANKPCKLLGFTLANTGGVADAGDAQEEDLRLQVISGLATVGSGGNSVTPKAALRGGPASGATCRINDTTIAAVGGGTTDILGEHGWNVRVEYQLFYPEEIAPVFDSSDTRLVIRSTNAPNTAGGDSGFTAGGTAWFVELR